MQPTIDSKPKITHRTFTYHSGLNWTGQRSGLLSSEGKETLNISSPPEFHGTPGLWTPEDLFVASVETCTMLTFQAFATRKNLSIFSYESTSEGMLEFVNGDYKFTRITIRPVIQVGDIESMEAAKKVLEAAHEHCIVSNSIQAEVVIEAEVKITNLEWALL
jgi:peroxiredoxin-like protein